MKLSTMLCLAFASGKLFGSLWKAEEEISDLVDIETVPSPLQRLLKEAESDSTEAEDDESSNDENIDEEDEDGTEDEEGFMQNRAVQLSGAAGVALAVGAGAAYWLKEGAPVKTPQGIAVTFDKALTTDAVAALNKDSKVLSTVEAGTKTIHTLYDNLPDFEKIHSKDSGAEEDTVAYAVFALQEFKEEEVKTIQALGTAVKDRVILNQEQLQEQLKKINVRGEVTYGTGDDAFEVTYDLTHMIITRVETKTAPASTA